MTPALHIRTSSPTQTSPSVPSPSKPHHTASRLRNLFTPHKSATFAVTITVHSVQNVPQVRGFFSVGWKFRDGEGNGRAKVEVNPSVNNGDTAVLSTKPPLPLPRNLVGKRRSLDTVSSGASSASRLSIDSTSIPPTSPNSVGSFASTTGGFTPIVGGASGRGKKSSLESSQMNEGSVISAASESPEASVVSSRRTSISGDGSLIPSGGRVQGDSSNAAVVDLTEMPHSSHPHSPTAPHPPSHLTVPIQHSRSTNPKTHSMHKLSASSLRRTFSKDRQSSTASHATETSSVVDSLYVPANTITERQGCTPIAELRNHSCEWGATVTHLVRMKIHPLGTHITPHTRPPFPDTPPLGILGAGARSESGLKLKVWQHIRPPTRHEMQRPERGSMKHRANGRAEDSYEFGGMNLDLAEFVGEEGKRVTRRYLLTERAKTNATIKIWGMRISSVTSDVSSMSATAAPSRNPSASNLRDLDCSLNIITDRPAPAMRLKKPPEEHLLQPPPEVTKSSTASKHKYHIKQPDAQEEARLRPSLNVSGNRTEASRNHTSTAERAYNGATDGEGTHEDKHQPESQSGPSAHQPQNPKRHGRTGKHKHHPHHVADPDTAPERIIEALFNPKPSNIWTPFTYVVDSEFPSSDSRTERPSGVETATPQRERRKSERQSEMHKFGIFGSPLTASTTMTTTTTDSDSDVSRTSVGTNHDLREGERRRRSALRRKGQPVGKARQPVGEIQRSFFKRLGAEHNAQ
ncbi:hypothetical protein QFC21_003959 [Naganishia friedmannii]|uniref:Uncharacterized protein n=1 Tax=Naganishia friedmannii TaxID=89922 RepID=A0ACC2VLH4_9TREE|nr:hypothetical protein QFC21_003959 [Naganishia friedmannii]